MLPQAEYKLWTISLVTLATAGWLAVSPSRRRPSVWWLLLAVPVLVLEVRLAGRWPQDLPAALLAVPIGVVLGAVLGCFLSQLALPLPATLRRALQQAWARADSLTSAPADDADLPRMSEAAFALAEVVRLAKPHVGLFTIGSSAALCDNLIGLQSTLEIHLLRNLEATMRRFVSSESTQYADVWKRQIEYVGQLLRVTSDSTSSLAARLQQFRQLTAILVASAALLVAVLNILFRFTAGPTGR